MTDARRRALAPEQTELDLPRAGRPDTPLATLGYEGRSLEAYLASLVEARVTLLCDVRSNPWSRKPGFSKRALAAGCASVGVRYEHLPELGIAKEKRAKIETVADREALFADYERETLPRETAAIDRILEWLASGERVALTCYELDFRDCHRSRLAAAVAARAGLPDVAHL